MKIYFFIILFFFITLAHTRQNIWIGFGFLAEPKDSQLLNNPISKMITWGAGYGFLNSNLVFLEVGYGLNSSSSFDSSVDRTSFVKIGYEKYFSIFDFIAYSGFAYGGLIRTIEATERGENWQVGETDYSFDGNNKRSVASHMFEINIGTRLFSAFFSNFALDWNTLSLVYNQSKLKYLSTLNIVYVFGG